MNKRFAVKIAGDIILAISLSFNNDGFLLIKREGDARGELIDTAYIDGIEIVDLNNLIKP
jgi:hypothetical protein